MTIPFALALVAVSLLLAFLVTLMLVHDGRRRAPRAGPTVTVDGVPLHYIEMGAGRPVVFLHGAKGSAYDAVLSVGPALARTHGVLAVDRPGAGYSGRADADNGAPDVQADLLHDAVRRLGIGPAVVVAHSAGAPVALSLALRHPGDVAAVVTLGGYLFSARDPQRAPNRILTVPVLGTLLRWTVVIPLGRLLAPVVLRRTFAPDVPDPAYARLAPGLALRPSQLAGDARDLAAYEAGLRALARHYSDLATPVVAVHGLADYVVSAAQAVRLCQLAPGCDLVLLEETGHQPHFTRRQAVLDAVALAWRRADEAERASRPAAPDTSRETSGAADAAPVGAQAPAFAQPAGPA